MSLTFHERDILLSAAGKFNKTALIGILEFDESTRAEGERKGLRGIRSPVDQRRRQLRKANTAAASVGTASRCQAGISSKKRVYILGLVMLP